MKRFPCCWTGGASSARIKLLSLHTHALSARLDRLPDSNVDASSPTHLRMRAFRAPSAFIDSKALPIASPITSNCRWLRSSGSGRGPASRGRGAFLWPLRMAWAAARVSHASPHSYLLHVLYDIPYNTAMYTLLRSATFDRWLGRLLDRQAVNRIVARLLAAEDGHLGDLRYVGGGVSEMRIQYGPGYRVYFITEGAELIVLLCGGDKDSQRRDIERAKSMAADWRS